MEGRREEKEGGNSKVVRQGKGRVGDWIEVREIRGKEGENGAEGTGCRGWGRMTRQGGDAKEVERIQEEKRKARRRLRHGSRKTK